MPRAPRVSSRFLSLVLRHRPDTIGLTLDAAGWVEVDALLAGCLASGRRLDRAGLIELVRTNDKQRFELSTDGERIRASQGHSVEVDLAYASATPPDVLWHGTVARVLPLIRADGLLPMQRHHVHLSADRTTAERVGARRGTPVLLEVDAARLYATGETFYRSTNGVWLVAAVPPEFLTFPPG